METNMKLLGKKLEDNIRNDLWYRLNFMVYHKLNDSFIGRIWSDIYLNNILHNIHKSLYINIKNKE